MPWSTSEIAYMANVTVNTVRHYHAIGLLDLPNRDLNGYKRYTAKHLLCLVRIRRLTELGVPLSSIDRVGTSGPEAHEELLDIDTKIEAELARLARSRADIAALLRYNAPADTPPGFEPIASRLSFADRAVLLIVSRLVADEAMSNLRERIASSSVLLSAEFAALQPDASQPTRERMAARLTGESDGWRSVDGLTALISGRRSARNPHEARHIIREVFLEFYSDAQQDVLTRASGFRYAALKPARLGALTPS
ncbi:MerR family transcriptional regulator [Arthrobacter sp. ATA002]|uniref:helix-turn-helix domain-containing protein n=1 Tax=Arthrobacter sp. ATA002 TaxID=2991715 RepID=UPI0022A71467|nr:MerR family transcriptional regulator [Arthrobacter sp. ATA002]WAP52195.1 MerR family transcriptional regulator [Arthrobacter sp. ATA002]